MFKGGDFDLTIVSHTEPMDIDIYARPADYYFAYDDADFQALMADFATETDEGRRAGLLAEAQRKIADDQVNAYLFQLAKTGRGGGEAEGLVGELAHPGERPDGGLLGRTERRSATGAAVRPETAAPSMPERTVSEGDRPDRPADRERPVSAR